MCIALTLTHVFVFDRPIGLVRIFVRKLLRNIDFIFDSLC